MSNFYNMDAIREGLKKDISTNNALIEALSPLNANSRTRLITANAHKTFCFVCIHGY